MVTQANLPLQFVDADSLGTASEVSDEFWVLLSDELVTVLGQVKMIRHAVASVLSRVDTDN